MARALKKTVRVAVSAPVRVQTVATTKLALALTFLGASFLAAAAAVNTLPPTPRTEVASSITPIGVTMSSQFVGDRTLFVPVGKTTTDGAPIMTVTLNAPARDSAQLRALTFNVIRATENGWVGDPTGCGLAKYSLTSNDGTLLGLTNKHVDDSSAVRFELESPLVIADSVTLQLRPLEFFAQATEAVAAQSLHGCRLLPVLAPGNIDLVGANDQPLPVLNGPIYGALTQVMTAQPQVVWSANVPKTLVDETDKIITLARFELKNNTGAEQIIDVTSLPLLVRTNAQATSSIEFSLITDIDAQPFKQTLLPEELRTQNTISVHTSAPNAWTIKPNKSVTFTLAVRGALQGQPGWYICTSVPADSQLTWNLAGREQNSPIQLPEFCVVKP